MATSIDEIVFFGHFPQELGVAYFCAGRLINVDFEYQGPRIGDVYEAQLRYSPAVEGAFAFVSPKFSLLIKDPQGKTEGQILAVQVTKEPYGGKTWTGKLIASHTVLSTLGAKLKAGPSVLDHLPLPCPPLSVTSPELLARFRELGARKDESMNDVIHEQLQEALEPTVTLSGGGTLVIEPTQALIAIDVNLGERDRFEQSAQAILDCNLSAAKEIARQVTLRRLSGRIVIDFISMKSRDDQMRVWDTLKESFKGVNAQLIGFTKAGLFELTLKRVRRPLQEEPYIVTRKS